MYQQLIASFSLLSFLCVFIVSPVENGSGAAKAYLHTRLGMWLTPHHRISGGVSAPARPSNRVSDGTRPPLGAQTAFACRDRDTGSSPAEYLARSAGRFRLGISPLSQLNPDPHIRASRPWFAYDRRPRCPSDPTQPSKRSGSAPFHWTELPMSVTARPTPGDAAVRDDRRSW